MTKTLSTATDRPSKPATAGGLWSRHPDAHPTDCYVDWVLKHYRALSSSGSPLIVPVTATFKPGSIRPDEVLREFERFYARLCSRLVKNYERPSKRHLLPFAIVWRDDPRTRPDKYSARPARHAQFFNHPSVAPHVHGLLVIHPQLVDRFMKTSQALGTRVGEASRPLMVKPRSCATGRCISTWRAARACRASLPMELMVQGPRKRTSAVGSATARNSHSAGTLGTATHSRSCQRRQLASQVQWRLKRLIQASPAAFDPSRVGNPRPTPDRCTGDHRSGPAIRSTPFVRPV